MKSILLFYRTCSRPLQFSKKAHGGGSDALFQNWVEYMFLVVMVAGFLIGFFVDSYLMNAIIIFFVGLLVGRMFYLKKNYMPFPRYLITTGFVLAFLIGASMRGSWKLLLFIFFVAAYIGYKLHKANIIREIL
ncbi:MAG: hypothetical protein QW594_01875 [Candidatus Woesearchaeota archaeon]